MWIRLCIKVPVLMWALVCRYNRPDVKQKQVPDSCLQNPDRGKNDDEKLKIPHMISSVRLLYLRYNTRNVSTSKYHFRPQHIGKISCSKKNNKVQDLREGEQSLAEFYSPSLLTE